MGIAQIALDPPPLWHMGKHGKKVPQTILTIPYTPGQSGKKVPQTILASLTGNAHMETTHFKKGLA